MEKICPLMSSADKIVPCTDKCAWRVNHVNGLSKCAMVALTDVLDLNGDALFNIHSALSDSTDAEGSVTK